MSRGMEVAACYSRHSPLQVGVGVRRDRRKSTSREPSCPPIAGDIRHRRWLSQASRLVAWFPGCRSPRRAARGRSRHRPTADSMPAGAPLTQCPPDRRWLKPARSPLTHARRIGADSCPLAAANPSPVDRVHMSCVPVPSSCVHRDTWSGARSKSFVILTSAVSLLWWGLTPD